MVVAVVDEGVGNGVAVIGVEALEQGLGGILLLVLDLVEECVGLVASQGAEVEALEIHALEFLETLQLIGADRRLVGPPVRDVECLVDGIGPEPFLGGLRDAGMSRCHAAMRPVDLRVGESGPGNPHGGPRPVAPDRVVGSRTAKAQRRALLANVPADTGENLYRTPKTKKTHVFKSEGSSQKVCGNTA